MSLALIQESAKEVRRLAIAGSPLAVGDFRLKKLIPPLEQAGAKVPVFAQVAKAISDLVSGKEAESAAHLLNLSTLLNAILYTQGQTGTDAPFRDLEMASANTPVTGTSARVLKPLIEALTTGGGGRFETVKAAVERGAFNDLRLIEPAIKALDDNYPELADLIARKVLPLYGSGIVPLIKSRLDLKGKKSDARRLTVLHELDPAGTIDLCKSALQEGSTDLKVAAIECLGKHEDCLPLVLEQAKAKNKTVREAALEALAQHDRPETTKIFKEMILGKAVDLLTGPLRMIKSREVSRLLLDEARGTLEKVLKNDDASITRLLQLLDCLQKRQDGETEEFFITAVGQADKLVKIKAAKGSVVAGTDLLREMTDLLYAIGTPASFNAILAQRDKVPPDSFILILRSALRVWPADKIYQEFAPLLEQKKGAGRDRSEELQRTITASRWDNASRYSFSSDMDTDPSEVQALKKVEWDPRWLDAAIKADHQSVVCSQARPGHKGAVAYLLKTLESKKESQPGLIIEALARCQYPQVTDAFLDLVARRIKNARYLDYEAMFLLESARHLPASDLPKLEAFAAKMDEKYVDSFLEAIEPLRPVKPVAPSGT
jgi:hypothetical protein